MLVNLTQAGIDLLDSGSGPFVVTAFQFGDGYNYVPAVNDTAIHGTEVFATAPNDPVAADGNTYIFSAVLDLTVGDFEFGEVGLLIADGTLVALAAQSTQITKLKEAGAQEGNVIRVDVYLRIQSGNYEMWIDPSVSSNQYRIPVLQDVDQLPPAQQAIPNTYILASTGNVGSSMAYTDRQFVWEFSEYNYATETPILAITSQSVTIDRTVINDEMFPQYLGELIIQFTDTKAQKVRGISRNVKTTVVSETIGTFNFATPLADLPQIGDTITIYTRRIGSGPRPPIYSLPPATTEELGGVIVGRGLNVTEEGLLTTDLFIAGAPFYTTYAEPTPVAGSRIINIPLPADKQIDWPLMTAYSVTSGQQIDLPVDNVLITPGQCAVTISTSVAVRVRLVLVSVYI